MHLGLCFWTDDDYLAFIQQVFIEHLVDARHRLGPGDTAENKIKQCLCFHMTYILTDEKVHKISGGPRAQKTNKAG